LQLRQRFWLLAIAAHGIASTISAQARWDIDAPQSLAWWQIDPHIGHLWATTCPQEPSWRPGEVYSGFAFNDFARILRANKSGLGTNMPDTVPMPRYPRLFASPVCTTAVSGWVTVADTVHWRGVRAQIAVRAEALMTGSEMRDRYMREDVFESYGYPLIEVTIDSIVRLTPGDTMTGTAVGTVKMRGHELQVFGPVQAWREGGALRVTGRVKIPAKSLTTNLGFSSVKLGLGIGTRIWRWVFMGIDVILIRRKS